jgi:5-methylcytosine-specific restriction endonuclease McrA
MKPPRLGTRRWGRVRAAILVRDLYRCRYGYPGCAGTATQVDHVHPRSWGGSWWGEGNLLSTCNSCHREKERRLRSGEPLGVFLDGSAPEMRKVANPPPPVTVDYSRKPPKAGAR